MKQKLLLKMMLLLCAIMVGSGTMWGDEITYTFTSKSWEAIAGGSAANWTSGKDGNQMSSGRGVQVTTGSDGANATSPTGFTNISKIVVTYSTNTSSGAGSISFKVGSNTAVSQNVTKTSGTSDRTLEYNFSPNQAGSVLMTVTCTTNSIYVKSVAITYSNGEQTATTIDHSGITNTDVYVSTVAGSLSASVKKQIDNSTINGASVIWSSSDENIATIGESTGVVTLTGVGTVTFTATYEGSSAYAGSTDTYEMTVTSSAPDQPYYLVTDASQLSAGDKIIIVSNKNDNNETVWYAMSTTQNANNRNVAEVSVVDDRIDIGANNTEVQVITLEGSTGAWYLNTGSGYLYAASSSSNYLRTDTKSYVGDNGKAAITFSGNNASIIFQGKYSRKDLKYNDDSSLFSCYDPESNSMTAVQIYKATTTITLAEACVDSEGMHYCTFSCSKPFVVNGDVIVSEVAVSDGKLNVQEYSRNAVVPANTGVMISSDEAGSYQLYYSSQSGTSVLGTNNMLKPSGDAGIDAEGMATATPNCLYYRLTMHNADTDNQIGFWWGAADGAAFALAANKAYLAVPASASGVQGFTFDAVDGIKVVESEKAKSGAIYNLAGQRVNKMQKGIYIVNGKKIFNK